MFVDGAALQEGHRLRTEVCIVGTGAAGIPLAMALADHGVNVLLLESGGRRPRPRAQALLDVELSGLPYPVHVSRERYFGGTTNHWGGVCKPFDAFELAAHDWVPHSGWPLERSELDPWYERARPLLGLPHASYAYDPVAQGVADLPPLLEAEDLGIATQLWRATQPGPARLGPMYAERVARDRRLTCVLGATVSELLPAESGRGIEHLEARTWAGRTVRVEAREFVLCAGAIENARLLLLSDSVVKTGLGNAHGLVGRYFMDHPGRWLGDWVLPGTGDTPFREEAILRREGGVGPGADLLGWATTPELRRAKKLLGFMTFGQVLDVDPASDLERAGIRELVEWLRGAEPSVDPERPIRLIRLAVNWEQSPNPASRVSLLRERDALGIRKVELHWAVHEADLRSLRESAALFARAAARSGHGRLKRGELTDGMLSIGAGHQMGTTRMASDPKKGVTDSKGAVHGLDNLFVAGSSLFPTGGWQHPTLTIVAMALRLAEHLVQRRKARR